MNNGKQMVCQHSLSKLKKTIKSQFFFCPSCGILVPNNVQFSPRPYFVKPLSYSKKTAQDPLEYLLNLKNECSINILYKPSPTEISQEYLNVRVESIAYLKKLCLSYHLSDKAFFSSLSYLDKVMLNCLNFSVSDLNLNIICCFILAAKFSENDSYPINISKLINEEGLTETTPEMIKEREILVLKKLNYNLCEITPYEILIAMLNCGIVFKGEDYDEATLNKVYMFSLKILTKIINSDTFIIYNNYVIAFSIVFLARRKFSLSKNNLKILKLLYELHFSDFRECAQYIKE